MDDVFCGCWEGVCIFGIVILWYDYIDVWLVFEGGGVVVGCNIGEYLGFDFVENWVWGVNVRLECGFIGIILSVYCLDCDDIWEGVGGVWCLWCSWWVFMLFEYEGF